MNRPASSQHAGHRTSPSSEDRIRGVLCLRWPGPSASPTIKPHEHFFAVTHQPPHRWIQAQRLLRAAFVAAAASANRVASCSVSSASPARSSACVSFSSSSSRGDRTAPSPPASSPRRPGGWPSASGTPARPPRAAVLGPLVGRLSGGLRPLLGALALLLRPVQALRELLVGVPGALLGLDPEPNAGRARLRQPSADRRPPATPCHAAHGPRSSGTWRPPGRARGTTWGCGRSRSLLASSGSNVSHNHGRSPSAASLAPSSILLRIQHPGSRFGPPGFLLQPGGLFRRPNPLGRSLLLLLLGAALAGTLDRVGGRFTAPRLQLRRPTPSRAGPPSRCAPAVPLAHLGLQLTRPAPSPGARVQRGLPLGLLGLLLALLGLLLGLGASVLQAALAGELFLPTARRPLLALRPLPGAAGRDRLCAFRCPPFGFLFSVDVGRHETARWGASYVGHRSGALTSVVCYPKTARR